MDRFPKKCATFLDVVPRFPLATGAAVVLYYRVGVRGMATKKPRVPVTLEPELLEQVTAYQRRHGVTSLSKAIRQLVRIGIASLEDGFTESPSRRDPELPAQERELLEAVRGLEPVQKAALLRVLEIAAATPETSRTREQIDVAPAPISGTGPARGRHNS